jgi:hypothetical protein
MNEIFLGTFVIGVILNLYFLVQAIDLPKYYKFPKNYLKELSTLKNILK